MVQHTGRLSVYFLILLSLVVLARCASHAPKLPKDYVDRPRISGLNQEQAQLRARLVSDVHYKLWFQIDEKETAFTGTSTVQFKVSDNRYPLTIDFNGGKILKLEINGAGFEEYSYNGHFLTLPASSLKNGENTVNIDFKHEYSTTGEGFYRFKDPEDGRIYMYTDLEPYQANYVFPCFDQPDLKATFVLKVNAPDEWSVISTSQEEEVNQLNGRRVVQFKESPVMSTYLFSLHLGPYKEWKSNAGDIPLRLFSRQSFAKYVDSKEWFELTRRGLAFYGKYFDYPYPFKKYDQLIVPDYNAGAMENIGAVTFAERLVQRGPSTMDERQVRGEVILHEMAHMWFGDLVTMKWWNDLWLNESFATYMSMLSLEGGGGFKKNWLMFYNSIKLWAYWEDQLVTTHPIMVTTKDTEQATAQFDGITYGKGASTLKQLAYFLGPDVFQKGVQNYFKKYQYKNATLDDFIRSLAEAGKLDLSTWTEQWITRAGVNTIESKWSCKDGKIARFQLIQSASATQPALRKHRTVIGFYKLGGDGGLKLEKNLPFTYTSESADAQEAVGLACPALVYPNNEDQDYVLVKLDPVSLKAAQKSISKLDDPLARAMVWESIWDMVRIGEFPLTDYLNLVLAKIAQEPEVKIASKVMSNVYAPAYSVLQYLPNEGTSAQKFRAEVVNQLEKFCWNGLKRSKAGSDFQKFWFDSFVAVAQSPSAQQSLKDILDGKSKFSGFKPDQDRRWAMVYQLNAYNASESETYRMKELGKDPSSEGAKQFLAAEVAFPQLDIKRNWFNKIVDDKSQEPFPKLKAAMKGMFPPGQTSFRALFADDFFANLRNLADKAENEFLKTYTKNLVPALCTQTSVQALRSFIDDHPYLRPVAMKNIKVAAQEDERCVKIRGLTLAALPGPAAPRSTPLPTESQTGH